MEISSATIAAIKTEEPSDSEWWAKACELQNCPHLESFIVSFSKDGETYYQLDRTSIKGVFLQYTYHKCQAIRIERRDIN